MPLEIFLWIESHAAGIQALFVSLSAVSALYIYWSNCRSQRRFALLTVLVKKQDDGTISAVSKRVRDLYNKNGKSLKAFVNNDDDNRRDILTLANHYELMAIAVHKGAFDEETYKSMEYTTVIRNWNILKDFIEESRTQHGNQTWFQDFEKLAKRWKDKPLKTVR